MAEQETQVAQDPWKIVEQLKQELQEAVREIQSSHEVLDGLNVRSSENVRGVLNEDTETKIQLSLVNRIVKLGIREADQKCLFKPGL